MPQEHIQCGRYDDEFAWNIVTDKYDKRKVKIVCAACEHEFAALCSNKTQLVKSEWRWVCDSHKEPCSDFVSQCPKCRSAIEFTVYTGQ